MKIGERQNLGDGTWHAKIKDRPRIHEKTWLEIVLDGSFALAAVILAVLAILGICLALILAIFLFY